MDIWKVEANLLKLYVKLIVCVLLHSSLEANSANDSRRYSALFASHETSRGGGGACVNFKLMFKE